MGSHERRSEGLVVSSVEDVERLRSSPARLWRLHGPIELLIPDVAESERERLESRLNELASVCGCAEGSAAGAIALIAVVVFWIQGDITFSYPSTVTAGVTVIGASLLAKLMRVISARVLLYQVLGELLRTLPQQSPVQRRAER